MTESLDDILRAALDLLAEGQVDPHSVWRSPTLITIGSGPGADVVPRGRTVVLRQADRDHRIVAFHTDTRSAKHSELTAQPRASLHCWDQARQVQLRLQGLVTLHTDDGVADAAWGTLGRSRSTYRVQPGPGSVLPDPGLVTEGDEAAGRAMFCVIRLTYDWLEYLHLAQGSHRRARFLWAGGVRTAMWLVP